VLLASAPVGQEGADERQSRVACDVSESRQKLG
jgi:hypothetical protein